MGYQIEHPVPYKGTVTLSIQHSNGAITKLVEYNSALPSLSKLFAYCVCNYSTAGMFPQYLDIKQGTVSQLLEPVLLTGVTCSVDTTDNFYIASVNALVTPAMLSYVEGDTSTQIYIYLVDASNNQLVELGLTNTNGDPITTLSDLISSGKNLIVNWQLKLCNYVTNS